MFLVNYILFDLYDISGLLLAELCQELRPNFKQIKTGKGFDVVRYAMAVNNELLWALDGLVEESE